MSAKSGYTLHAPAHHPNGLKIRIVGKYSGVEIADGPSDYKFGVDNKTPEFMLMNPMGQVPTVSTPDGPLFESMAIARYVAQKGANHEQLLGKTAYEQAVVDQWVHFARSNFEGIFNIYGFSPLVGSRVAYDEKVFKVELAKVEKGFTGMELSFKNHDRKFIAGNHVTLADIAIGATLYNPLRVSLDTAFLSKFPKVHEYLKRYFAEPNVTSLAGALAYVDKFVPPQPKQ